MERIYIPGRIQDLEELLMQGLPAGRTCAFVDSAVVAACSGFDGNDEERAEVAAQLAALSAAAMSAALPPAPANDRSDGSAAVRAEDLVDVVIVADIDRADLVQSAHPEPQDGRYSGTYVTQAATLAQNLVCVFRVDHTDDEQPDLLWFGLEELDALVQ